MLPAELLDTSFAIAAAVAAVAGAMRGFTGFGSAMLMAPIYAILFGPAPMIAIIMVMELLVTIQLLPTALRNVQWPFVGPMALAAGTAIPLGGLILAWVEPELLTRSIAVIVVGFVLVLMSGWRYHGPKRLPITAGLGFVSGAMMASTSMGGPPVLLYMLSGQDPPTVNRANIIVYFGLVGMVLIGVLIAGGLIGVEAVLRGLLLTPAFMLAAWIGARLFRQSNEKIYRWSALLFLLAVGLFGLLR